MALFDVPALLKTVKLTEMFIDLSKASVGEDRIYIIDELVTLDSTFKKLLITFIKVSDKMARIDCTYGSDSKAITRIAGIVYIKRFILFRESFVLAMINISEDDSNSVVSLLT